MPALRSLNLACNKLTELPDDLGQRLPRLTEINLWSNKFTAVPLAALSGATSLEKIDLDLQSLPAHEEIEGQLESLLGRLPRLQELRLSGSWERPWDCPTPSGKHAEKQLLARLRERNPNVRILRLDDW